MLSANLAPKRLSRALILLCLASIPLGATAQNAPAAGRGAPAAPAAAAPQNNGNDTLAKEIDDLMWYQKLGDIAEIDKSEYGGPPIAHPKHPKEPGATNPVIIHAYTLIPKNLDRTRKQPLIVYVHQGIHGSFETGIDAHMVRELILQGYTIVATDYRGSSGYGRGFYEKIDYGGKEVDDVFDGHEVDARPLLLPRPQTRRHHRLEPRRHDHPHEHLRPPP